MAKKSSPIPPSMSSRLTREKLFTSAPQPRQATPKRPSSPPQLPKRRGRLPTPPNDETSSCGRQRSCSSARTSFTSTRTKRLVPSTRCSASNGCSQSKAARVLLDSYQLPAKARSPIHWAMESQPWCCVSRMVSSLPLHPGMRPTVSASEPAWALSPWATPSSSKAPKPAPSVTGQSPRCYMKPACPKESSTPSSTGPRTPRK